MVCSKKCTRKYPPSTSRKTEFVSWRRPAPESPRSFSDSGIISSSAVASLNPAPSPAARRQLPVLYQRKPSTVRERVQILRGNSSLARMPEQNHVAILHDVFFSFELQLRLLFRRRKTSRVHQILPVHHFSLDEPALDVAVNRAGRFLRVHPALDSPGTAFRFARGKK